MTPIKKIKAARKMLMMFMREDNPDYLPEVYTILQSAIWDLEDSFEYTQYQIVGGELKGKGRKQDGIWVDK